MTPRMKWSVPKVDGDRRPDHFAIEEWVDFARGLVAGNEAKRMQQHANRCAKCREFSTFYTRLHAVTRFMPDRRQLKAGS